MKMVDDVVVVGAVDVDGCTVFVFATGTGRAGATSSVAGAGALLPTSRCVITASVVVFPAESLWAVEESGNSLGSMRCALWEDVSGASKSTCC
jgi:hypothetical protein